MKLDFLSHCFSERFTEHRMIIYIFSEPFTEFRIPVPYPIFQWTFTKIGNSPQRFSEPFTENSTKSSNNIQPFDAWSKGDNGAGHKVNTTDTPMPLIKGNWTTRGYTNPRTGQLVEPWQAIMYLFKIHTHSVTCIFLLAAHRRREAYVFAQHFLGQIVSDDFPSGMVHPSGRRRTKS